MIGERVRLAREACLLTQTELAALAGVSQGTLSDVEAGVVVGPSQLVVQRIARSTLFPEAFFYQGPLPDLPEGHYRKLKKGTMKVSKQVRAQVRQVLEIVQRAERDLRLPPVRLEPVRAWSGGVDTVENVAAKTRSMIGVGHRDPIPNVMRAVERAGVVVIRLPSQMEDHDGFSAWPDYGLDGRPILAIASGRSGDRDRFTIAHEIGHLQLHTLRAQEVNSSDSEREAQRFAGALLLPVESAREVIRKPVTLRVLMDVKATFGISIAASARRARDLHIITPEHYTSLLKQLSARGWRREEPVSVPPEQPLLISKVIDYMAGTSGSTMERAGKLAMPLFTFRALVRELAPQIQ